MNGTTFRVLGPVKAWHNGRLLPCRTARHRAVLAAVLVDVGDVVPCDVLVDRVWSGRPPAAAEATLQAVISRLQRELEPDAAPGGWERFRLAGPGYRLTVDPEQVNEVRLVRLLRTAQALAGQDVAAARSAVAEGLDLWHGPAYATVAATFATNDRGRLAQLRLDARELAARTAGSYPAVVRGAKARPGPSARSGRPVAPRRTALTGLLPAARRRGTTLPAVGRVSDASESSVAVNWSTTSPSTRPATGP